MADLRTSVSPPAGLPARPLPPARAEAVRAAQRAFFDTALAGEAQAAAPATTSAATAGVVATPAPRVTEVRATFDPDAPAPSRLLRPGSLLDIKV